MTDIAELEESFVALVDRLDPRGRVALARSIGTLLRKSQAERIKRNLTPDGAAMVPRKAPAARPNKLTRPARGALKKGLMFQKAIKPAYLRAAASPAGSTVGFTGSAARIMRVHQDGGIDHVDKSADSPEAVYPARHVLGLTAVERAAIMELVRAAIAL